MVEFIDRTSLATRESEEGQRAEIVPDTDHDSFSVESAGYTYSNPPLTNGLVGWWPLHDNQARDLSGNDNHGTPNGGVTTGVAGRGGLEAMSFDGNDDYISVGGPGSMDYSPVTFSCWVHIREPDTQNTLMSTVDGSQNGMQITYRGDENEGLKLDVGTGSSFTRLFVGSNVTPGWYHVAGVYDGTSAHLYVDGEPIGSAETAYSNDSNEPLNIGRPPYFDGPLNGVLLDCRVYSRALSDAEIRTLYEWGSVDHARPPTDGVARYALDGDATDSWGSNDGTNNGVSFVDDAIRGQSGYFDGDSHIDTGYAPPQGDLSVSVWANIESTNTGRNTTDIISTLDGGPTDGFKIAHSDDTGVRLQVYQNDSSTDTRFYPVAPGAWHHFASTYVDSTSTWEFYINGSAVETFTQPLGTNQTAWIGDGRSYPNDWGGWVDDVRIYDYALTPEEVFQNYLWGTRGIDLNRHTVKA